MRVECAGRTTYAPIAMVPCASDPPSTQSRCLSGTPVAMGSPRSRNPAGPGRPSASTCTSRGDAIVIVARFVSTGNTAVYPYAVRNQFLWRRMRHCFWLPIPHLSSWRSGASSKIKPCRSRAAYHSLLHQTPGEDSQIVDHSLRLNRSNANIHCPCVSACRISREQSRSQVPSIHALLHRDKLQSPLICKRMCDLFCAFRRSSRPRFPSTSCDELLVLPPVCGGALSNAHHLRYMLTVPAIT
jgi:hypothetical protein